MTLEDSKHSDVGVKGSSNKMLLTAVSSATAVLQKIGMFRSKDMFMLICSCCSRSCSTSKMTQLSGRLSILKCFFFYLIHCLFFILPFQFLENKQCTHLRKYNIPIHTLVMMNKRCSNGTILNQSSSRQAR